MRRAVHTVDVDRVVLDGLEMTPEQAERLRPLLEAELRDQLERGASLGRLAGVEVLRIEAPAVDLGRSAGEERLAAGLAGSVGEALSSLRPSLNRS